MRVYVECKHPKEPCWAEEIEAKDVKTAKRIVADNARANGFTPRVVKAIVLSESGG